MGIGTASAVAKGFSLPIVAGYGLMPILAGLSLGKDIPLLKTIGWKIIPVGLVAISAPFLLSTMIAEFAQGVWHQNRHGLADAGSRSPARPSFASRGGGARNPQCGRGPRGSGAWVVSRETQTARPVRAWGGHAPG